MSTYFSDADKAKVAYLFGRLTAAAEALGDSPSGGLAEMMRKDLVCLRKLILPETCKPTLEQVLDEAT